MSFQTAADIPIIVASSNSSSERRISPSWSIAHLKSRLEPITGIPVSSQQLTLRVGSQDAVPITAADEEQTQLSSFALQPYAEITVLDTRPPSARTDFSDLSAVPKYTMPSTEYETRSDSVLAWKKAQKLGRFDPNAPSIEEQKIRASEREVEERGDVQMRLGQAEQDYDSGNSTSNAPTPLDNALTGLTLSSRVRLLPATDARRGTISYVGLVPEIPGLGSWIGITLDEPTGKNDGSVKGKKYFECGKNYGVFVKPERCEAGDFPPLDLGDEDMEEL